jgi:DNA-binding PadR family transcriptional regulator
VYGLTPAGKEALAQERLEWGSFAQAIKSVLDTV